MKNLKIEQFRYQQPELNAQVRSHPWGVAFGKIKRSHSIVIAPTINPVLLEAIWLWKDR